MAKPKIKLVGDEPEDDDSGIKAAVDSATPDDPRPVIEVAGGQLAAIATRAIAVLVDSQQQVFQRGGNLVRPVIEEVDASRGRKTQVAQIIPIDPTYMRDSLNRVGDFQRYDARRKKAVSIDPPLDVANTVLKRRGEWPFPAIAGVISTPTMREDGSLLTQPGFDDATRLLLLTPPRMAKIPDRPTRTNALAALTLLKDLLREFPLVDPVAISVALSALITPVVRGAFPVAPMHVMAAPVAGSGKSYLLDTVATITIGHPMPVMAAGRTEEETEKRLGAALLAGQPLISIDNVNGELFGDALCQIIERPLVEIRILGKSERVRIESRGTTVFCTGNNVVLVGDLCRRSITATLDPMLERPELRVFTSNPVTTVLADRGKYIAAALTICRAYVVAGRPDRARALASFEGWSNTVRSALIWLGESDPVDSMEATRGEDPELIELREVLLAWAEAFGIGPAQRRTLQDVIERSERTAGPNLRPANPSLNAAVKAVAGKRGPPDAKSLGSWAQRHKGRVVEGVRLVNKPNPKGKSEWWIESLDGAERPPEQDQM